MRRRRRRGVACGVGTWRGSLTAGPRPRAAARRRWRSGSARAAPGLHGAERRALVGAGLLVDRRDVHAALGQALLDHRVHVHERLDRHAQDPLPQQPPQAVVLAREPGGGQRRQRADAEVAAGADVAPDGGHRRVRQRGLLRQQVEQRALHRGPQLLGDRVVGDPVGEHVGLEVEPLLEPVVADQRHQRPPGAGVVAQQVAHRAAVRVRAGQRGQVAPGHLAGGLLLEPGQHAGVGEPVHRVQPGAAARAEHRLDGDAADVRRVQGALDHEADLVVVDPERGGHRQRREDPGPERRSIARSLNRRMSAPRWWVEASADSPSYCR